MKTSAKRNLLFTVLVLALAGVLFLAQRLVRVQPEAPKALLMYGNPAQEMYIDLGEDATYNVDTGYYTIHLRVEGGTIAFVDSPCPDHLCEGFGQLKAAGDWAACLPALASLTIEGE